MKLVFEILSDSLLALNQLDNLLSSQLAVIINELKLLDIKKRFYIGCLLATQVGLPPCNHYI